MRVRFRTGDWLRAAALAAEIVLVCVGVAIPVMIVLPPGVATEGSTADVLPVAPITGVPPNMPQWVGGASVVRTGEMLRTGELAVTAEAAGMDKRRVRTGVPVIEVVVLLS